MEKMTKTLELSANFETRLTWITFSFAKRELNLEKRPAKMEEEPKTLFCKNNLK
jgi:hypothetical protein